MKKRSDLEKMKKNDLLELAREVQLRGRSKMSKAELIQALSQTEKAPGNNPARKKSASKKAVPLIRSDIGFNVRRKERVVPDSFQQEVERGRFDLGIQEKTLLESIAPDRDLPLGYGDDRIVLQVRDPYWIYSYWEIQEETVQKALAQKDLLGHHAQKVVRVYIGDESNYQDIEVEELNNNWYITMGRPDLELFADFGLKVQGQFIALARSNRVRTPRSGMSDVIDDQWMTLDEKAKTIYALSGGFRMGEGSLGLQEMMERRLLGEISSGAISSFFGSGKFREKPRGFWYHLDAELIVYGATEADAEVSLQGRPIQLRPDGTFTARFALPDGSQEIPVTFISSDKIDRVTVEPKVVRRTETR